MKSTKLHYPTLIFWSEEDGAFIATIPGLPYISAHGDTYEEAAAEIEIALEACEEVAKEEGRPLPPPIGLDSIHQASSLLNLSELARRINVSQSTLTSKLKRGTQLKQEESYAIHTALRESGLFLVAPQ